MKLLPAVLTAVGIAHSAAGYGGGRRLRAIHDGAQPAFSSSKGRMALEASRVMLGAGHLGRGGGAGEELEGASRTASNMSAAIGSMVWDMLTEGATTVPALITATDSHITLHDALATLEGKLPPDVEALVRVAASKGDLFDEEAMQKARRVLNNMIFKSLEDLDEVVMGCHEFKRGNRMVFDQVDTDLARLGSELADTERKIAETLPCISDKDAAFREVHARLNFEEATRARRAREGASALRKKQDEEAFFGVVMEVTKCSKAEEAAAFARQHKAEAAARAAKPAAPPPQGGPFGGTCARRFLARPVDASRGLCRHRWGTTSASIPAISSFRPRTLATSWSRHTARLARPG